MSDADTEITEIESFHELVYDKDAWPFIKEKWPEAIFTDASDFIHEGRFEVEIPGITDDDFYPRMIVEGWVRVCFSFELAMMMPERRADVLRWIAKAKEINEAEKNGDNNEHTEGGKDQR